MKGSLYGDRIGFDKEVLKDRIRAQMKGASFLQASGLKGAYHIRDLYGNDIGGNADHPDCPNRHKWQPEPIIAGKDGENLLLTFPAHPNPVAVPSSCLYR